jgi:hypothetical protein
MAGGMNCTLYSCTIGWLEGEREEIWLGEERWQAKKKTGRGKEIKLGL